MEYGCPVECKYCVISQVAYRREQWEKRFLVGMNKAVTILNPPPDRDNKKALESFYSFPLELLRGDVVGFNAISDPFWAKYRPELEWFLEHVPPVAKGVTLVTKMPVSPGVMRRLAQIPNLLINISITGLDQIEMTNTESRLRTLALAKQYGVRAYPVIHPYIAGMTDLSFLPVLRELGYNKVDVKGLRFDPIMADWMPPSTSRLYQGTTGEVLIEDGWRKKLQEAGLQSMSLREWTSLVVKDVPCLPLEEAKKNVERLLQIGNITSSDTDEAVIEAMVKRRI